MVFGISLQEWTLLIVGSALFVALLDFYLTHVRSPKSDIVFNADGARPSNPRSTISGEVQMELYFAADNRGRAVGYVTGAELDLVEFYNGEQGEGDNHIIHVEELTDGVYGAPPVTILHEEDRENDQLNPISVHPGESTDVFVVPRIWGISPILDFKDDYEYARARVNFSIVDAEREYQIGVYSDSITSSRLEPP